jgi:DNA-binding Lrp family transcriptional regulator
MKKKPNLLKLATKISLESLTYLGITYNDPEYKILEPIVDDDMCDIMMHMRLEANRTVEDIAKRAKKSVEFTQKQLDKLNEAGVIRKRKVDGKVCYSHIVLERQTLFSISKAYNVSLEDIYKYNPSVKENGLKKNSILIIPCEDLATEEPEKKTEVKEDDIRSGSNPYFPEIKYAGTLSTFPVLRCCFHLDNPNANTPILNLSYSGNIFYSFLEWETGAWTL